jgi:two-component system, sporulation sensor kinase E
MWYLNPRAMISINKKTKYRSLFQRSIDPIFLTSPDFLLTDANESFLKLLDYSSIKNEIISLQDIFERSEDFFNFREVLTDFGQVKNMEVALKSKAGVKKSCLVNCIYIADENPDLCCYQGIIHDLTERKQAESDSLNAERLSLTGKIARTIAHELRNPLTNLTLALDQLRSELPIDNVSINQYGAIIERNINRIEQLVEEMLNSSKPKGLYLEPTPVATIIEDAINQANDRILLNQILVQMNFQQNLPTLLVDKEKIRIAILNIIINAIEAMTPGKGILKINAYTEDNSIVISITDNGKGVPASDLDKLFDPFFTAKHSGIGLGLTSAKNILTSHNAQIEVKSTLHAGTTFYVRFKRAV